VPLSVRVAHRDAKTGLPKFAWLALKPEAKGALKGVPARDAAWSTLRGLARAYRLHPDVLASAEIESVHDTGKGPIIARFKQRMNGIDVFRTSMSIAFTRDMDPVAASGSLARVYPVGYHEARQGQQQHAKDASAFEVDAHSAVAAAARAAGANVNASNVSDGPALPGDYTSFVLAPGALGDKREIAPTRARKVWFDGKGLEPAYYVEVDLGSDVASDAKLRSFVVSAVDGTILFSHVMTANDVNAYRVYANPDGPRAFHPYAGPQGNQGFPHPTGHPDGYQAEYVAPNLVSLSSSTFSRNDPWLPQGATTTTGNNVDAFANIVAPDGFQAGDVRPAMTSPNAFDYTYDHSQQPGASANNIQAGVTQLFYTVNFMHDWFYDVGFDETSFNAQRDNYGRGGTDGDPVTAQAQDYSGRNNANASTPADGASPRIRMYIFDGIATKKIVTPSGDLKVDSGAFGPKSFLTTGIVAAASPSEACAAPLDNAAELAGKIVLVDRGTCSAIVKTANAQAAGAIGVIIANNVAGPAAGFTASNEVDAATITIPTLTVSQADGAALAAAAAAAPLEVTLRADAAIDRDGSLDTAVVSHEWGHTLSNRLIGNGSGLTGTQAGGMGEGWSDFVSLLTLTRPENAAAPANPDWSGVFGLASYDMSGGGNDGYYYGIRRVPYSVDLSKNALTFKHVSDGVPLPTTTPIAFGADGADNSEVHNTGEVWATMLFECYVSLLRDSRYTFEQANERMRRYLVASLKLTPNGPTITDARDAVLAAAYATDKQDFEHFVLAFARRGAGVGAVSPPEDTSDNTGVVESFVSGADVEIVSAKVEGTASSCNPFAIVRNGDHAKLTIAVQNSGTAPLLATTMTLSSTDGKISFPNGSVINLPAMVPFGGVTTVEVDALLQGAAFGETINLKMDVTDPDLAVPRVVSLTHTADYNYDVSLLSSRVDLLDTPASGTVWTVSSDETLDTTTPWSVLTTGSKRTWSLPDAPATADYSLVTPSLVVAKNVDFKITFDHRYSFERSSRGKNFDGGVIELSADAGATWFDIGALASPGYGGVIDFTRSTNPLKSRAAFVGQSAGYPDYETVTVDLGTSFSGNTVKIRFRAGTDDGGGAPGWDIARFAVDGTTNTPFASRIPVGVCANP
jgi:hypothetical protein